MKSRKRLCNNPRPSNGGTQCVGGNGRMHEQTIKCPTRYCGKVCYALDMQHNFCIIIIIFILSYILIMLISTIVCVKDTYPKGLKSNCKKTYPCAKLARRNMCRKRYNQIMNLGCKNQISGWLQKQPVRNFCKKSCKNCLGEYFTLSSI